MRSHKLDTFRRDIELLLAAAPSEAESEDVSELVEILLQHVGTEIDIAELERRLTDANAVNFDRVKRAAACFDGLTGTTPLLGGAIDLASELQALRNALPADGEEVSGFAAHIRLLSIDTYFERILLCVPEGADLACFESLLGEALEELEASEIPRLWSELRSEFDSMRVHFFSKDDPCVPPGFFDAKDREQAIQSLVAYVARVRPALSRKKEADGHPIPVVLTKITIMLGAKDIEPIPAIDRRLARCMSRLYALWATPQSKQSEFAAALGIRDQSWFAKEHEITSRFWRPHKPAAPENLNHALLRWLLRLVLYADAFVDWSSPEWKALRAYKLGAEVAWEPAKRFHPALDEGWIEERFQRNVARFLVERGIMAFGTKFGSVQTDLRLGVDQALLVEVKIYKTMPEPHEVQVDVGQLLNYMGQEAPGTRGVLVVFNYSDTALVAENRWLDGIYIVLPINLCKAPPSQTKQVLEIRPGTEHVVEVRPVVTRRR